MGGCWEVEDVGNVLEEVEEVKGKMGGARAETAEDRSSTGEGGSLIVL